MENKKTTPEQENAKIFFIERFGKDKYKFDLTTGYFNVWVERFKSGSPSLFMDSISLRIHQKLKKSGRYY